MRRPILKDDAILVRVGRDEKRELAVLARRHGMTVSQLLREGARSLGSRAAA